MISVAEIVSRTLSGLADPSPEVCSLNDAMNAAIQSLNVRLAQSRASDTTANVSVTPEFFPDSTDYDITSFIGEGIPLGVEVRDFDAHYVHVQSGGILYFNQIGTGSRAAAFYSQANASTGELRQFVRFRSVPDVGVRVYYDADAVKTLMEDSSGFPDSLGELFVIEAQNILIPKIKLKMALNMPRDENEIKYMQMQLSAYDGIFAQNMQRMRALEQLFVIHAMRGRGESAKGFTRQSRTSRYGLYE